MTGTLPNPTIGQPNSSEDQDIHDAITGLNAVLTPANKLDGAEVGAGTLPSAALDSTGLLADDLASAPAEDLGLSQTGTARRGVFTDATEETTTSTSYVSLGDEVASVVLPTDGLLFVMYRALWKLTGASNPGSVALFLGSNQLKLVGDEAAPGEVGLSLPAAGDNYAPVATSGQVGDDGGAFQALDSETADSSLVTTGSLIGLSGGAGRLGVGEPLVIDAAAGTYTVSVRFKVNATAGGTLSVKQRKLWVWTLGF